jgi:NAD(P)-dependent dehydrogenase (short-subunit alcohol dehydrogenase family)
VKLPFSEMVAWITGASSGIGRACALELARLGAAVAVSGRRRDRLDEVVRAIEQAGGQALAVPCDVCDEASVADAVERVARRLGRLDVALANAGFAVGGRVEELDAAAWRRQLDTNVVGAALVARHALPQLRRTAGRIAFTGSVAAFVPAPGFAAYHCSKYALRALALTLQAELEGTDVSCTIVHPGFVESEINQVDNEGRFHPERTDRRPHGLMWPTDRAARVIVEAIRKRRREVVFTGHGRVAVALGMHFPSLAHLVMTRGTMRRRADGFRAGGSDS